MDFNNGAYYHDWLLHHYQQLILSTPQRPPAPPYPFGDGYTFTPADLRLLETKKYVDNNLTSFLEFDNSFLTPWNWNNGLGGGSYGPDRRMRIEYPGSLVTYDNMNMETLLSTRGASVEDEEKENGPSIEDTEKVEDEAKKKVDEENCIQDYYTIKSEDLKSEGSTDDGFIIVNNVEEKQFE